VKFLVDADVLSESTKPSPDMRVVRWLRKHESEIAVSPVVLGELEFGILLLPAGRRRTRLQEWFTQGVQRIQVLDFDALTASTWADLLRRLRKQGLAMPVKDSLIAATALVHGLTVATRNTTDYQNAGIRLVNPFRS
jgi:toxin FitB